MPKQITGVKDFLEKSRRKDTKFIKIKKNKDDTVFKVRTSKYLYTLILSDAAKAEQLREALPKTVEVRTL